MIANTSVETGIHEAMVVATTRDAERRGGTRRPQTTYRRPLRANTYRLCRRIRSTSSRGRLYSDEDGSHVVARFVLHHEDDGIARAQRRVTVGNQQFFVLTVDGHDDR